MPRRKAKPQTKLLQRPWALGILLTILLYALIYSLYSPQYVTNDDAVILRAFMGYEGGVPATFHLYTHTVFAWLLYGLAELFPGVAWFSILQLALLFVSAAVIIKSCAQLLGRSLKTRFGRLIGAALGLVFTAAFALFYMARITYSFTAVFCGAAAVAQVFSIDFERGKGVISRILGGAALLLCGYFLRQITVLPPLCFFILAIGIKLLTGSRTRRVRKPVLIGVLCTGLLFGLFAGVRAADIALSGTQDYIDWQDARISVMDYTDFGRQTSAETLKKIGWTDTLKKLAGEWYFMDDRVTTDAFRQIKAQVTRDTLMPPGTHFVSAWRMSADYLAHRTRITLAVLGALLLAGAGIAAAREEHRLWAALGAVCAMLGGAAIVVAIAWQGRMTDHAVLAAILPMSVYFTASAFAFAKPLSKLKTQKALTAVAAVLLAGALVFNALAIARSCQEAERKDHKYWGDSMPEVDIDEYALLYPDTLFIHDYSMPSNEIVFPDTEFGIPTNVTSWGGWEIHSPTWEHMMMEYGIYELNASIFVRDNVVFATRWDRPPQLFLDYLEENLGVPVTWEFYDTYGKVFFYTFRTQ